MSFSDRIGVTTPRQVLQLETIDSALMNGLWQCVIECYLRADERYATDWRFKLTMTRIYVDLFKIASDQLPYGHDDNIKRVRSWFFNEKTKWWQIYNLIDFMVGNNEKIGSYTDRDRIYINRVNFFLEREKSGYRIVGDQLTKITDNSEMSEVEVAISAEGRYAPFSTHMRRSLELFSDRLQPDYRNNIKEAISAIESVTTIITGDEKATLGSALKKLNLHEGLKQGFLKLYGWTSDAGGIRHALSEQSDVDEADAKFMIVACSAFGNYLIQKHG